MPIPKVLISLTVVGITGIGGTCIFKDRIFKQKDNSNLTNEEQREELNSLTPTRENERQTNAESQNPETKET